MTDNYRPVAITSVLSNVLERVILNRCNVVLSTSPNQFGFKSKHGTEECIFV